MKQKISVVALFLAIMGAAVAKGEENVLTLEAKDQLEALELLNIISDIKKATPEKIRGLERLSQINLQGPPLARRRGDVSLQMPQPQLHDLSWAMRYRGLVLAKPLGINNLPNSILFKLIKKILDRLKKVGKAGLGAIATFERICIRFDFRESNAEICIPSRG